MSSLVKPSFSLHMALMSEQMVFKKLRIVMINFFPHERMWRRSSGGQIQGMSGGIR